MSNGEDNQREETEIVEEISIREIFNCIKSIREPVLGIETQLWENPAAFVDFLVEEIQYSKRLPMTWGFFSNDKSECAVTAQSLIDLIAAIAEKQDEEESLSTISWDTFLVVASDQDCFSMCFPSQVVITNLELIKDHRLKLLTEQAEQDLAAMATRCSNKKERDIRSMLKPYSHRDNSGWKRKYSTGSDDFETKSKKKGATADGRDPSSQYTSTSARIMNTCKY